mmetsp:Transcript_6969/g.21204  ORF Transcript_6969/g.21204 Transcript_6969/m.21204 type:complete len:632 (+) Transcript_6969:192-2087(+)
MSASLMLAGFVSALLCYVLFVVLREKFRLRSKVKAVEVVERKAESEADKTVRELTEFCEGDERTERALILYGTEYGFSKEVAKKTAEALSERFPLLSPRVLNMLHHEMLDLSKEQLCLVCCSTTGDGVVPTEAKPFHEALQGVTAGVLGNLPFSVLALGDQGYPHFCRGGVLFNTAFESATGSAPFVPMKEIDQEEWDDINDWIQDVSDKIEEMSLVSDDSPDYLVERIRTEFSEGRGSTYNMSKPLHAELKDKRLLTKVEKDGDKETVHVEFDLAESGMTYRSGDALAVVAKNSPDEVDAILLALGASGAELVKLPGSDDTITLSAALTSHIDLKTIKPDLVVAVLAAAQSEEDQQMAKKMLGTDAMTMDAHQLKLSREFQSFVSQRFIIDVLECFPSARIGSEALLNNSRALIPRFYSISSSPMRDERTVSITAAVVRYDMLNKPRKGVATTYLADRVEVGESAPIYVQKNNNFRLPADDERAIVMIGAGTGVAPYIAFLQDRDIQRSSGQNLLFFGCRHEEKDFLYREELQQWEVESHLELFTAFSRDTKEKVYVQNRLEEQAARIWALMNDSAHIYVCGDATHMATDVHDALLRIIEKEGGLDRQGASDFMQKLEFESRYQRDVWIS